MTWMDDVIDQDYYLSVITEIELRCWKTDALTQERIRDFISDGVVLPITPSVIEQCVQLRRKRRVKTPDAIIAATALANGQTLITANTRDFSGIKGLKLTNPHDL